MADNKNAYVIDSRKPITYPKIKGWDEVIVETAGFVPLAVRFKQMEQAGYRARFNESEFSFFYHFFNVIIRLNIKLRMI